MPRFLTDITDRLGDRQWYNVQNYGATGDGSTSDTTCIHAARDAAGVGGTLYFPPGTYMVSALTPSVADQKWVLHPQAILKQIGGQNFTTLSIAAAGVTIEGGTIDGNKANVTAGSGIGIQDTASNVTIRDVKVKDTATYGINVPNINDVRIIDCKTSGTTNIGIFVSATANKTGLTIDRCTVDMSTAANTIGGIAIHGGSTNEYRNVQVTNCIVTGPTVSSLTSGICLEVWYAPGAVLNNNTTTNGAMGISTACKGATVVGNTCYNAYWGIEVANGQYTTVTGNTIEGNSFTLNGIALDGDSSYSSVVGNTVRMTTQYGIYFASGSVDQTCTGNVVRHSAGYGINVTTSDGSTFTGNSLDGSGGGTRGIWTDNAKQIAISDNTIRNYSTSGIRLTSATDAFVIDNVTMSDNVLISTTLPLSTSVSGGASVGNNVVAYGNVGIDDYLNFNADVRRMSGTGSPEGSKTAGVGSIYHRTDGGTGTTLYIKESGTGNTGWVAAGMSLTAGDGLTATGSTWAVNTGSGLEINSDTVRIATGAAGTGLTGGGGSALSVDTPYRTLAIPFHIQGTLTTGVKTPEFICPVAGTISPMRGRCSAGSGVTYRLVKNGSSNMDTSSSTGTSVVSTTLSTNTTVAAGDRVQIEVVNAGTGGTDLSVTAALVVTGA